MALMNELDIKNQGKLTEESKGAPYGEIIRDYDPVDGVKWRFGTPNYARVNEAYFQHRSKKHEAGSLEDVVSKLVKSWEVESHHIADISQWKTMDIEKFSAQLNGGPKVDAQLMADVGPYNMLIGEHSVYSAGSNTFESANTIFSEAFSEGFAWECLEVLAGPPICTFKWRHFGQFTGTYTDKQGRKFKGNGEMVSFIGLCIAKVSDALKIESLDVYYNPDDLLQPLVSKVAKGEGEVDVGCDEADTKVQTAACCSMGRGADEHSSSDDSASDSAPSQGGSDKACAVM